MRLTLLLVTIFALFAIVYAWDKEDYEIFDLVSAIEAAEGKGTTFYSWLDVPPNASEKELSRAYRKKSMALHPDKNPGVKGIHERFARLGVVAAILRDPEGRKRYDFFYKNGVPRWRGTGYYYSRYRPGLGSVLVFLAFLSSALQYMVQKMNYNRDIARIERIIHAARVQAWGPKLVPLEGARKARISTSGDDEYNPGRLIEVLVEKDAVYLLGDEDPVLLGPEIVTKPAFSNTWVISIFKALFAKIIPAKTTAVEEAVTGSEEESDDTTDGTVSGTEKKVGVPVAASKAGGRRRKAGPRKK